MGELAGDKHPVTGIRYDLDGFLFLELFLKLN
ncbi:hypothetical protein ICW_03980 [Bacillus wiedmannii]|nr:hypothetical protein ICW_03980 [Bacillus wiedmannii]EJV67692.1 hypothetical protein IEO_01246 [Bacillus wiedmannii]OFD11354.1 hypothetical protein BTGOE6_10980 [Bacillus wiedmannii]